MSDLKYKEANFNKIINWLKEIGFVLENIRKKTDPKTGVEFYCEVRPYRIRKDFFKIIISNSYKYAFQLQAFIIFDKQITDSLDVTRWKEQQQIFINFRKYIYPLGISFESNQKIGGIILHKLIFMDTLSKQYFFDSVTNMINAMLLVGVNLDEFRNTVFPKGD